MSIDLCLHACSDDNRQVYNASNNELVRTNTLVKSAIIQVDATPFRQWYEAHVSDTYLCEMSRKLTAIAYSMLSP